MLNRNNKLNDKILSGVSGGAEMTGDAGDVADQIIAIDYQIQASPTRQPTEEQVQTLGYLKFKMNVLSSGYSKTSKLTQASQILYKYGIY